MADPWNLTSKKPSMYPRRYGQIADCVPRGARHNETQFQGDDPLFEEKHQVVSQGFQQSRRHAPRGLIGATDSARSTLQGRMQRGLPGDVQRQKEESPASVHNEHEPGSRQLHGEPGSGDSLHVRTEYHRRHCRRHNRPLVPLPVQVHSVAEPVEQDAHHRDLHYCSFLRLAVQEEAHPAGHDLR